MVINYSAQSFKLWRAQVHFEIDFEREVRNKSNHLFQKMMEVDSEN